MPETPLTKRELAQMHGRLRKHPKAEVNFRLARVKQARGAPRLQVVGYSMYNPATKKEM
jgi:hypothetical protein